MEKPRNINKPPQPVTAADWVIPEEEKFAEIARIPLNVLEKRQAELVQRINEGQANYVKGIELTASHENPGVRAIGAEEGRKLKAELDTLRKEEQLIREYLESMTLEPVAPTPDTAGTVQ